MKKTTNLLFVIIMLFSFAACGQDKSTTPIPTTAPTTSNTATPKPTPTQELSINITKTQLAPGQSIQLSVAGAKNILWSSSDPYIAKVDKNGVVTGRHKGGTTTITARTNGQTFTSLVTNTVKMREVSAKEIVADFKIGTNYAGALEDIDWERKIGYDGSTSVEEKIKRYKQRVKWVDTAKVAADFKSAGYNAVRLDITFTYFSNDQTFEMDKEWLDLIEATANDFLDNNMYCIIEPHYDYLQYSWVGDHWDGMWMLDKYDDYVNPRFEANWSQVAKRFADYDDYILFEAVNEPTIDNDDYTKTFGNDNDREKFLLDKTNEMNAIFLNVVRKSGGNNARRNIILALPEIESARFLQSLVIPENDNHIIATIHYYFHHDDWSTYTSWSRKNKSDTQQIDEEFTQLKKFMDKTELPVILGEWGNTEGIPVKDRIDQVTYILEKTSALGVPAFWFECTIGESDTPDQKFPLYNRYKNEWYWPEIRDAIMDVVYKK